MNLDIDFFKKIDFNFDIDNAIRIDFLERYSNILKQIYIAVCTRSLVYNNHKIELLALYNTPENMFNVFDAMNITRIPYIVSYKLHGIDESGTCRMPHCIFKTQSKDSQIVVLYPVISSYTPTQSQFNTSNLCYGFYNISRFQNNESFNRTHGILQDLFNMYGSIVNSIAGQTLLEL